jgi:ABC-type branched-subunit amino acid transport system ATPase component
MNVRRKIFVISYGSIKVSLCEPRELQTFHALSLICNLVCCQKKGSKKRQSTKNIKSKLGDDKVVHQAKAWLVAFSLLSHCHKFAWNINYQSRREENGKRFHS